MPRIYRLSATPRSSSPHEMALSHLWFAIIESQAIRRGIFTSATALISAIRSFTNGLKDRKHPFTWTKAPDEILDKKDWNRKTISTTRH